MRKRGISRGVNINHFWMSLLNRILALYWKTTQLRIIFVDIKLILKGLTLLFAMELYNLLIYIMKENSHCLKKTSLYRSSSIFQYRWIWSNFSSVFITIVLDWHSRNVMSRYFCCVLSLLSRNQWVAERSLNCIAILWLNVSNTYFSFQVGYVPMTI